MPEADPERAFVWTSAGSGVVRRRVASGADRETAADASRQGTPEAGGVVRVPESGATLLVDLCEAALSSDTPRLREILRTWRTRLVETAQDGWLPPSHADARFSNLLAADATDPVARARDAVPLADAMRPATVDEATWAALADLYATWRRCGLRHPWPSSMHPQTVFESLVAMAGAPRPGEPERWFALETESAPVTQTRQELLAVIERQREELRGAWSRFHWDEKNYLVYKTSRFTKRTLRHLRREGIRGTLRRGRSMVR